MNGKHMMPGGNMMKDSEMKKRMTSDGYMMDKKMMPKEGKSVLPAGKGADKFKGAKFIKKEKPKRGDFPRSRQA